MKKALPILILSLLLTSCANILSPIFNHDKTDNSTTSPPEKGPSYNGVAKCSHGPLTKPIKGCSPTPPASTGDPAIDCVNRINQFRWECQCLPPLQRWTEAEACAQQNAAYDAARPSTPHAGFRDEICHTQIPNAGSAFGTNECPTGWGSAAHMNNACLKMMWDEYYTPGIKGHYQNMSSSSYSFIKVACGFANGVGVQLYTN